MAISFKGKVAIVTGVASGLGRASALAFAAAGAKVIAADVDVKAGEETVQMIKKAGGEAAFVKTDVSKAADVKNMVDKAVSLYGRLDFAHNNAGIMIPGPVTQLTEEQWDTLMDINLKGAWLCMKYELLQMEKAHSGSIVNTSSLAGLIAAPMASLYATSKWGLNGLTKSAAVEFARSGIRINAICPHSIKGTRMWMDTFEHDPALSARLTAAIPMGRDSTPEEQANAVVWLCSDEASFITGVALPVDGGTSAT
jgi:NAD(P)-dependent dehydrogenase (short-subunit alcohol dehydrogenase family)